MAGNFRTVHVQVKENVTLENLHAMVARIVDLSGCRTCGLLGIDLRLSVDPAEAQDIAKLPGVKGLSFGE
jgi:hypothetical protein